VNTTVKQILWGVSALLVVGLGVRLADAVVHKRVNTIAGKLERSLEAREIDAAEDLLGRLGERRYLSRGRGREHRQRVASYRPRLDQLKVSQLLVQTGQDMDRLHGLVALGAYAEVRAELRQVDQALTDVAEAARKSFDQTLAAFAGWLDALEMHRKQIQAGLDEDLFWQQAGFDPGMDALRLAELADLVERHAAAPGSRLIGEDRKSVRGKQKKLLGKVLDDFQAAHDWTRDLDRLEKARATRVKQLDDFLRARKEAPEHTGRLSLKKSKADYTVRIDKLQAEIQGDDRERERALQALGDIQRNLGRRQVPDDIYPPYLDLAYLAAYNVQLLQQIHKRKATEHSGERAGLYLGQVQVMHAYVDRHVRTLEDGMVNRSFMLLRKALQGRLDRMERAYAEKGTLDAVLAGRIDGAAILAFLDNQPPRDEVPADNPTE
jgi:hypothetical protein